MTRRATLTIFAAYTALAIVITFPLVLHLSGTLAHDLGDPLLSTAILRWNAHTLPFTDRWWNGFAFFPAPGMLAFSDHRLGASLIASPIQWLGGSDVTAYNLTLLLLFPLSALGGHALGFTLTKRHDAAAICGLAYGFNPYRIAHIEHLELLAGYGMPFALAALHRFAETRKVKWIALFAVALTLQGLSTSYFLLFFCVLLALWLLWFAGWRDWRFLAAVAIGGLCAAAALSPVIVGYLRIHRHYGMVRDLREVLEYSADLTSFVTASPLLSLWSWTNSVTSGERQLFPGLAVTLIAFAGAVMALRRPAALPTDRPAGTATTSIALAALALATMAVALSVRVVGPWKIGALRVSEDVFKTQSVALLFLVAAIAALPATRRAFARRSALAFYLFATGFLFLCSLGPKPAFRGAQFLYEPPYAWLMHLPVFDSAIRAPARFAMPAVLTLSAASAIAFARLTAGRVALARWAFAVAACAIIADTWIGSLPMVPMRSNWSAARAAGATTVLELPLGTIVPDVAAMYRATLVNRPAVNGYSGFMPPHYAVLRRALKDDDETVLGPIAAAGPVLVALDRRADPDRRLEQMLNRVQGAAATGLEGRWAFFLLPKTDDPGGRPLGRSAAPPSACRGRIAVAEVSAPPGVNDSRALFDGDPESGWISEGPQKADAEMTVTLARQAATCSISLLLGTGPEVYPGAVAIELSADGVEWLPVFSGKAGGLAMAGALEDPRHSPVVFNWPATAARLIRVRLLASQSLYPWAMREIIVGTEE